MNKTELKKIAQTALEDKYGFKPSLEKIRLLESSDDGKYILFKVRKHEYEFNSWYVYNSIWCGENTITKKS